MQGRVLNFANITLSNSWGNIYSYSKYWANHIHEQKQSSSGKHKWLQLGQAGDLDSGISKLGPLLSLLLCLAELGKVEGSNLLSFLNLLLVGLDLLLQLASQVGHSLLVLPVFILSKGKFLNLTLSTLVALHVLRSTSLDTAKLILQLTDSHLKLGHGSLSSLHGSNLSISKASFKVSKLSLKGPLGTSLGSGMILLSTELISKAGSINHGLLGLLLGILGSSKHRIKVSLDSVDSSLKSTLGGHFSTIDGLHFIACISGIINFHIQLALSSLSRVKKSLALLNFTRHSSSLALSNSNLLNNLSTLAGLILIRLDGVTELTLVALDGLQTLSIGLVGMVKSDLKFVDISLKLILDAESLTLGSLLSFQRSSQGLHCTLVVLTSIVELLFLLSDTSVNLLADLAKFKLGPQDLVFFLLKGSLSLLKSGLELFLLLFQSPALFVQVMDGAATISKLIKKILDLISKVLVLTLDNVKLFKSLILSSLQTEELRAVVTAFILGSLNLSSNISSLSLPFAKNLVKV